MNNIIRSIKTLNALVYTFVHVLVPHIALEAFFQACGVTSHANQLHRYMTQSATVLTES